LPPPASPPHSRGERAASHANAFIHRDYHPGNVLFQRNEVSGVVDWPNASVGAIEVDLGHCRHNLAALHGVAAADAFLDAYYAITGARTHDPYYDIVTLLDVNWD